MPTRGRQRSDRIYTPKDAPTTKPRPCVKTMLCDGEVPKSSAIRVICRWINVGDRVRAVVGASVRINVCVESLATCARVAENDVTILATKCQIKCAASRREIRGSTNRTFHRPESHNRGICDRVSQKTKFGAFYCCPTFLS